MDYFQLKLKLNNWNNLNKKEIENFLCENYCQNNSIKNFIDLVLFTIRHDLKRKTLAYRIVHLINMSMIKSYIENDAEVPDEILNNSLFKAGQEIYRNKMCTVIRLKKSSKKTVHSITFGVLSMFPFPAALGYVYEFKKEIK